MARARNIKPAFFQNQELGELQPIDRLAFIGMWTIADFRGCIELKLKRLKIQILPYDDCSIESIVNNLEKARFIRTYSVQGQSYIKIINFEKHQNPHKNEREAGSEIPDISEAEEKSNEIKELNKDGTKPDLIGTTRADSLSLIPDSPILIPDSLIPSTSVEPLAGDTPKPKKPAAKKRTSANNRNVERIRRSLRTPIPCATSTQRSSQRAVVATCLQAWSHRSATSGRMVREPSKPVLCRWRPLGRVAFARLRKTQNAMGNRPTSHRNASTASRQNANEFICIFNNDRRSKGARTCRQLS